MIRMAALTTAVLAAAASTAARAQDGQPAGFPQLSGEVDLDLYNTWFYSASERRQRYNDVFLRGDIGLGLHLLEGLSIQAEIKFEPVAEGGENGGSRAFQDLGAFVESLFIDWRPTPRLALFGGKFTAPFGYGHHDLPGILLPVRAEETYEIAESLGFGARWTFLSDPRLGEHDLTAAVFTLDTSPLSNTAFTRKRFGVDEAERYRRNARMVGGPGNTGRLDNVAVALDGDGFAWLPGFAYHAAILSRGAGRDGTRREWGYALGAKYELAWSRDLRTLLFAEHIEFRNAGGRAVETLEVETEEGPQEVALAVSERRRFTTLGARTTWGPWRATAGWQRDDRRRRPADDVPREDYVELSVGHDLPYGFAVDVGWSYATYARDDGNRGARRALLSWRLEF